MPEVLLASAPHYELVLTPELALFLQIHLQTEPKNIGFACPWSLKGLTESNRHGLYCVAYITSSNGVHGEQVVAVAQLELDHLLSGPEVGELLLL